MKLFLILTIIAGLGGAFAYHQVTVSQLELQVVQLEANNRTLKENQVQMEIAVNTAQSSLKAAEENQKQSEAAMSALTSRNQELNREKQTYLKIFKDHNLTRLARARPGMIEKRINNGTQKVFEALENDTKELMDIDDTNAGVLPDAPKTGVGSETDTGSTGTTDSNGN